MVLLSVAETVEFSRTCNVVDTVHEASSKVVEVHVNNRSSLAITRWSWAEQI